MNIISWQLKSIWIVHIQQDCKLYTAKDRDRGLRNVVKSKEY